MNGPHLTDLEVTELADQLLEVLPPTDYASRLRVSSLLAEIAVLQHERDELQAELSRRPALSLVRP